MAIGHINSSVIVLSSLLADTHLSMLIVACAKPMNIQYSGENYEIALKFPKLIFVFLEIKASFHAQHSP